MPRRFAFLVGTILTAGSAVGHVPVFSDGSAVGRETAIRLEDVTISRVIYHEVTEAAPQVWATFEANAATRIPVRLGVPMIDRLASLRPVVVIFGPGLPAVDVPFPAPEGLGGIVLSLAPGAEPEAFHEEFTGTDSWIMGDLDLSLPVAGRYYVVAYVPSGASGKLWVALGDREVFGPEDIANFGEIVNQVREFHEIAPSPFPCFVPLLGAASLVCAVVWFHSRKSYLPGADEHGRHRYGPRCRWPGSVGKSATISP